MTKKVAVALFAVLALASPVLAGELKYTMHMEARPAANAANDPMSAMAGGMISQMFPPGGIDQTVVVGEKGARSEYKQDFATFKAGSIMLIKPDGTQYVLDPAAKTYYKVPAAPPEMAAMMAQMAPKVTVGKRGVFETINGQKAEHLTLTMTMGIPGVDPSQLPPGVPTEISMGMDVWLGDSPIKMPAAAASMSAGMLKQFGMDQMKELKDLDGEGKMMLKTVLTMFGVEMVMETRDMKTETVAADFFEIPKDYKEVPPGI